MNNLLKVVGKKDERCRYYVAPVKIVWSTVGAGNIVNIENLLSDDLSECVIIPSKYSPPAIVIDFGKELNGGVGIDVTNRNPANILKVRLRFGESVSEVMGNPNNDHAIHDTIVDISVWSRYEYGSTGFRFVRLDFLECAEPVHIRSIYAVALERPFVYQGHFHCSDPILNEVWQVGARTVHLCCQDYILDGIKRDRLVWMGDIHPQLHVIAAVFGDQYIVDESIARVFDLTPKGEWINGHSSYSLWWLIGVWEWYFYTGRTDWLNAMREKIVSIVKQILENIHEDGRETLGGLRFIDWSVGYDNPVIVDACMSALTVMGLNAAVRLFEVLENQKYREVCLTVIEKIKQRPPLVTVNKQVNALRVLAQMENPQSANDKSLALDPCRGLSPWFGYYILEARAMADDITGCLDLIRQYWGKMIALGATTFWEHFEIDWCTNAGRIDEIIPPSKRDIHAECGAYCFKGLRHSLCHGWSSGPTAWLSRHILGIQPCKPGLRCVRFFPRLGDLDFAEGFFPTPYGRIEICCKRKKSGTVESFCAAPQEVEVIKVNKL